MKYIYCALAALLLGIQALFATDEYPGYTRLQWVETDRNQYIDTGLKAQNGLTFIADMRLLSNEQPTMAIFGGADNHSGTVNPVGITTRKTSDKKKSTDDWAFIRLHGHKYSSSNATARAPITWATYRHIGQRAIWKLANGVFSFNGYKPSFDTYYSVTYTSTNNIYLCWMGGPNNTGSTSFAPAAMVLYSFKIQKSSTTLRSFIPVIRDEDGEVGLLDTVSNVFYENLGSKPFIAGPRVSSIYPFNSKASKGYRSELTVAGYTGGATVQSGLPVLVRISADKIPGFSYDACLEGGADIFFATDPDGKNRLACDIDTWDTTGESLAWVKLPEVVGTETKFYVFWGAGDIANRPSSTEVWSEYVGVWHMNECDEEAGVRDETGHGFNATNSQSNVSTPTEAVVGRALNLSHGLLAPNYETYTTADLTNTVPDVVSISLWFKKPNGVSAAAEETILRKYGTVSSSYRIGYCISVVSDSTVAFKDYVANVVSGGASGKSPNNTSVPDFSQNWLHHVLVSTGTNHTSFVNGAQKVKNTCAAKTDAIGKYNSPLRFGMAANSISMDEVRITRIPRSASWVKAEYDTMANPDFIIASTAEELCTKVSVAGKPFEYANDVVKYGIDTEVTIGEPKVYSVPQVANLDENNRAVCIGWELYATDSDEGLVLLRTSNEPMEGEDTSTCIVTPTFYDVLTWNWQEECLLKAEVETENSGSISGAGWQVKGQEVQLSAVPAQGYYFYRWQGDTEGIENIYSESIVVTMDSPKALKAVFRPTTDCIFDVSESSTVDFYDPSNWLNGNVPTTDGTSFVLMRTPPEGVSVTATISTPINIACLDMGVGMASGAITLDFACALATNSVAGDVTLHRGMTLTHACHAQTANEKAYALNLEVGGNMIVEAGATVDATAKGYYFCKGPMPCDGTYYRAGGHGGTSQGGYATDNWKISTAKCYGSIRRPQEPGSGGGSNSQTKNYGGGVIHIVVKNGTLTVDGTIGANGGNTTHSSPAGGSVWIECGKLAGTGSIDAYSGKASSYSNGAGGRIAVRQYIANDISAFTGLIRAGRNPVASESYNAGHSVGSIYIENANDAEDRGELIAAGYNCISALSGMACRLDSTIEDVHVPFGKVSVKDYARLEIPSDVTLKVEKGISVTGSGDLHTAQNGGAIEIMPGEDGEFFVEGLVKAYSIYCTNSPGATISFAAGAKLTNFANGTIKLCGTTEKLLSLLPATQDAIWDMNPASKDYYFRYIAISNGHVTSSIPVTAYNSEDLGGNNYWGFLSEKLPEATLFTWVGSQDTSWENPINWDMGIAPRDGDLVRIPSGLSNYPVASRADLRLASITNEIGASLTLDGINLYVSNVLYSAGAIVQNGQKIIVNGDGDSILDFASGQATLVYVEKNAGKLTLPSGFAADKFYCVTPDAIQLVFGAGERFEFAQCNIESRGAAPHVLCSTATGQAWALSLTDNQRVRNVTVSDSDASGGTEVKVSAAFATDAGNNLNWSFGSERNIVEWIAGSGNWSTAENWSTGEVPGENDDVFIAPVSGTVTVTASAAVNIRSLTLGGTDAKVNLTSAYPVNMSGDFVLGDGVVVTLSSKNTPNAIGGNVLMKSGSEMKHAANEKTFAYRLYMAVGGNMTIESGAKIALSRLGFEKFYGPVDNVKNVAGDTNGGGHGSTLTYNSKYVPCNDSIFEPILPGTGGSSGGAGAVYFDVAGDLTVDGEINVRSHRGTNAAGAPGAICLKVGTLKGTGLVTAAPAPASVEKPLNCWKGGAGRIAIYQRVSADWTPSGSLTITTQNNDKDGTHGGTIYKELPGDGHHGGTIYIEGRQNIYTSYGTGFTQLPMAADGDPKRAYKNATLVIGAGANIRMVTSEDFPAGAAMKVKDIIFEASTPMINFYNTKILVMTLTHKDGAGWTGGDYASRVSGGKFTNCGGIEWYRGGFQIMIK